MTLTQQTDSSDIEETLKDRGDRYGNTWHLMGLVIQILQKHLALLIQSGFMGTWVLILGKMLRILFTPCDPEHWHDIAGYALLVERYIRSEKWHDLQIIHQAKKDTQGGQSDTRDLSDQ